MTEMLIYIRSIVSVGKLNSYTADRKMEWCFLEIGSEIYLRYGKKDVLDFVLSTIFNSARVIR